MAKRLVSAWQNPIHDKSGKELQMTTRIHGKEREGKKSVRIEAKGREREQKIDKERMNFTEPHEFREMREKGSGQ